MGNAAGCRFSRIRLVITVVEPSGGATGEAEEQETFQDPILARLASLLVNKVGAPFSDDDHRAAVKEGHRRVEAKIAPGFKDGDKKGDDVVVDLLGLGRPTGGQQGVKLAR